MAPAGREDANPILIPTCVILLFRPASILWVAVSSCRPASQSSCTSTTTPSTLAARRHRGLTSSACGRHGTPPTSTRWARAVFVRSAMQTLRPAPASFLVPPAPQLLRTAPPPAPRGEVPLPLRVVSPPPLFKCAVLMNSVVWFLRALSLSLSKRCCSCRGVARAVPLAAPRLPAPSTRDEASVVRW